MKECTVTFIDYMDNYKFSIALVSHYTTVIGFDSGEGKTWMFDSVNRKQMAGELRIECEFPVIFSTVDSLERDLDLAERIVIITDEYTIVKSSAVMKKMNRSKHLILAITRAVIASVASPLDGIYKISVRSDSVFRVERMNHDHSLPLTRDIADADIIITESAFEKSEHQFLSGLCNLTGKHLEIVAAGGKDNIAKKLRSYTRIQPNARIIVFTDLGNISSQYRLLRKRCNENPNIRFFDYDCFEELLCEGTLFSQLDTFHDSVFDYVTPERYYEKKLECMTRNTPFSYRHRQPVLSLCYIMYCVMCDKMCSFSDDDKLRKLLDSDIGEALYQYFFGADSKRL